MRKTGWKLSEEARLKIRLSKLGKKRPNMTGPLNPNYGKDMSGSKNPSWKGGTVIKIARYHQGHPEVQKYNSLKSRSKINKIPCDITLSDFRTWYYTSEHICSYCERDISKRTNRMDNLSIDRKLNHLGYTLSNLCLACNRCNTVKGNTFTFEQMREIAQKYLVDKTKTITSA